MLASASAPLGPNGQMNFSGRFRAAPDFFALRLDRLFTGRLAVDMGMQLPPPLCVRTVPEWAYVRHP